MLGSTRQSFLDKMQISVPEFCCLNDVCMYLCVDLPLPFGIRFDTNIMCTSFPFQPPFMIVEYKQPIDRARFIEQCQSGCVHNQIFFPGPEIFIYHSLNALTLPQKAPDVDIVQNSEHSMSEIRQTLKEADSVSTNWLPILSYWC